MRSEESGSSLLRPMRQLLDAAEIGCYGVGAFNVSTLDQAYAVVAAANWERSPVIVQAIAGTHAYGSDEEFWGMLRPFVEAECEVPVALHLDHGQTFEDCSAAIGAGFTSVMRDASRHPVTGEAMGFEENVAETLRVVEIAHAAAVTVEGEIGTVGGGGELAQDFGAFDYFITNADDACRFADETGVDALALAVGTSHGSVKFPLGRQPELAYELIREVHSRIPATALVLHGSSSAFAEDVARINEAGGVVRLSSGITPEAKQKSIACGIRKVNQGTDSHLAFTAAAREHLRDHPRDVDPVFYLRAGIAGMTERVALAMQTFGSAGRV